MTTETIASLGSICPKCGARLVSTACEDFVILSCPRGDYEATETSGEMKANFILSSREVRKRR